MEDNSFAQRLRKLRERAGLTQPELAYLVGVHETTIRRWEIGKQGTPNIEYIKKISQVLNVSEEELFSEHSATWSLRIEVANDFKQEVIDLTKKVPCLSSITTTPNGGFLTLGGDYQLWTNDELFKKLISDLKKLRKTVIQNGIAQGGIKND